MSLLVPLLGQDPKPPPVDQAKVDAAISRGCEYLLAQHPNPIGLGNADMLVLLTLLHGGVSMERLRPFVNWSRTKPLDWTYNVSLLAMCSYELWKLEKDPEAAANIVARMKECAQWLVDNQTSNGQWRYGFPVPPAADSEESPKEPMIGTASSSEPKSASLAESRKKKSSPGPTKLRVAASRRAFGTDGDNSNSQYAALGLRACMDVGIEVPREVLDRAIRYFEVAQDKGGAWGYDVGGAAQPAGWGSMTAGAIGALTIYNHYLARDMKQVRSDPTIVKGLKWLDRNFAVDRNPAHVAGAWHLYYLYGLERVGVLYGTEWIGNRAWYSIGAEFLLKNQKSDGSWKSDQPGETNVCWDTCFAVLFLRRATRPLTIESEKAR
jgi:hypothetical protein